MTGDSDVGSAEEVKQDEEAWLSRRNFFILLAVLLLLITTERFRGDLPAFFWSLAVLGGAMYLE